MKRIAIVYSLLMLSACATTPIPLTEARPVPSDEIQDSTYLVERPNTYQLDLVRDSGYISFAHGVDVTLDGKPLADFHVGERLTLWLPGGEHILGMTGTAWGANKTPTLLINVPSHLYHIIQISGDGNGWHFTPVLK